MLVLVGWGFVVVVFVFSFSLFVDIAAVGLGGDEKFQVGQIFLDSDSKCPAKSKTTTYTDSVQSHFY